MAGAAARRPGSPAGQWFRFGPWGVAFHAARDNTGHKLSILAFIVFVFDPGEMARDRLGPDRDRLLVARLDAIARRLARWGALTDGEQAGGVAELREVAGDRFDLLAEVAGIALGTSESKGDEYRAQAQAVAELCRMAGADEVLIPH
jgi:hypothetical protein